MKTDCTKLEGCPIVKVNGGKEMKVYRFLAGFSGRVRLIDAQYLEGHRSYPAGNSIKLSDIEIIDGGIR